MKALVYCFSFKKNLGDNFFLEAYQELFPELNFTFSDKITEDSFNSHDIIFLGGGSFLDGQPNIPKDLLDKLPKKPLIYIGVGAETDIHPWHKFLIKKSKLVCIRSHNHLNKIEELNKNTIVIPDLVYSLYKKIKLKNRIKKSILFIPNAHTISKWNDLAWKQSSWENFKSEFSQVCEELCSQGFKIDVLPMCHNNHHKDNFAAVEIYNKMNIGNLNILPFKEHNLTELSELFSSYELIISQRYHGLVVADMTKTPCINIHHHDKLKEFSSPLTKSIEYYGVSKTSILAGIDDILFMKTFDNECPISIKSDVFGAVKDRVKKIISKD